MDIRAINASTTSFDATEEEILPQRWLFSNEYSQVLANHVMMVIQVLGFVGIFLVFLVARHMVKVENKAG